MPAPGAVWRESGRHGHDPVRGHGAPETLNQTTLWPASSVSQLFFHADVHASTIDLLDLASIRALELEDEARRLLRRSVAAEILPPTGVFGPIAASMRPSRSSRHEGRWAAVLAGALEEYEPFRPASGTCLRCAVVRPLRTLHALRSPTYPIPLYVCADGAAPPDRLRPSIDDHWGSPCSCPECRHSLVAVGAGPLLVGLPAAAPYVQPHNRDRDLLAVLRGTDLSSLPPVHAQADEPDLRN